MQAFTSPGDGVVIMDPVYGPFEKSVTVNGSVPARCSLIRERMPEKTVYFTIVRDGEKGDCYRRITITLPEKEREEWETLLTNAKIFAVVFAVMTAITIIGYLLYAAIMGGKYIVEFEMDENGIEYWM